jgi:hypothetical protein
MRQVRQRGNPRQQATGLLLIDAYRTDRVINDGDIAYITIAG